MKFGFIMFPTRQAIPPGDLGRLLEDRGFESLFMPDHTHIPAVTPERYDVLGLAPEFKNGMDAFVALGAIAQATSTLQMGTAVVLVTKRDPMLRLRARSRWCSSATEVASYPVPSTASAPEATSPPCAPGRRSALGRVRRCRWRRAVSARPRFDVVDDGPVELRQLRYFVAVAEELHFGRAAERLLIAQSAVSQQVRRLERELGAELLDRSPRQVRLTAAGESFLPYAREVLRAEQRARGAVARFAQDRGSALVIGTSRGLGERLDRVLEALHRLAPQVTVDLVSAPLVQRLHRVAEREWDAAFLRGEVEAPEEVRQVPVWRDELVAALPARHPLAAEPRLSIGRLAGLALFLTARQNNPPLVDLVVGACARAGFEPPVGPAHSSLEDTLATLGSGREAWTVVYASHARQLRVGGRIVFVPVYDADGGRLALPTVLAVHRGTSEARLRPLLEACREVARGDLDS